MHISFPGSRTLSGSQILNLTPYAVVLVVFLSVTNVNLKKDYANGSMEVDGKGYYAYLPALFIYHDLSFGFFKQVEKGTYFNRDYFYDYLRSSNNRTIDKYYCGTAFCMLPFFALGHLTTLLAGTAADGYSYYYMLWIHLGALFYLLLGLLAVQRLLRTYKISERWIAISLVAIGLGTNLFYYTLTEYSMSHVYSFAAISSFVLCARKYFLFKENRLLLIAGFLLGIIVLIRPVNLLIILSLPFIAGRILTKKELGYLLTVKYQLLAGIIIFIAVISIQLIIYKIQTGQFLVYSYPGEGFNFLQPHFWEMLFSYRKGLFVYTPVCLLSLSGFLFLWRSNRFAAASLAVFLVVLNYILSCWHVWYYGGSFSQRVFIDFYMYFALLLAFSLEKLPKGWLRQSFMTITLFLILFCQFQTFQYRHMIIHWSDMNREKYWESFMQWKK